MYLFDFVPLSCVGRPAKGEKQRRGETFVYMYLGVSQGLLEDCISSEWFVGVFGEDIKTKWPIHVPCLVHDQHPLANKPVSACVYVTYGSSQFSKTVQTRRGMHDGAIIWIPMQQTRYPNLLFAMRIEGDDSFVWDSRKLFWLLAQSQVGHDPGSKEEVLWRPYGVVSQCDACALLHVCL